MKAVLTKGLVLRQQTVGERDRLIVLYTEREGKVLARCFGLSKVDKLLAGHLLPFLLTELNLVEKNGRWTINDARSVEYYHKNGSLNIARLQIIGELIDVMTEMNEPDTELFDILAQSFKRLLSSQQYPTTFLQSLVAILQVMGLMPSVDRCVVSGNKITQADGEYWWSSLAGGLVSKEEHTNVVSAQAIKDKNTIKLLRLAVAGQINDRIKVGYQPIQEAEQLLLSYIQLLVQKNIQSLPLMYTAL